MVNKYHSYTPVWAGRLKEGHYTVTARACPVQIEGIIEGHYFYFRARGSCWEIGIGISEEFLLSKIWTNPSEFDYYKSGCIGRPGEFAGSWMEHLEALEIIKKAIEEWKCN